MDQSKSSEIPKLQIMWQNREYNSSLHWLLEKQKTITTYPDNIIFVTTTKKMKLTLTLATPILTHIWKTRNKLQFDDTIIPATNVIINIKNELKNIILTHYKHHTINNTLHEFQSSFCINNALCK